MRHTEGDVWGDLDYSATAMFVPSKSQEWCEISRQFEQIWNFPNCTGNKWCQQFKSTVESLIRTSVIRTRRLTERAMRATPPVTIATCIYSVCSNIDALHVILVRSIRDGYCLFQFYCPWKEKEESCVDH